jgi:hypothetical protein
MQQQTWKAIESSLPIHLSDSAYALLDRVQAQLALSDNEFARLLTLITRLSPNPEWLATQLPPLKTWPPHPASESVNDLMTDYNRKLVALETQQREFRANAERRSLTKDPP